MEREVRKYEVLDSLTSLEVGERGTIVFIGGGKAAVQRLMDMGLTQGTQVEILACAPFHGPVELRVRGTALAIGRGLANKILVRVISRREEG